MNPQPKPRPAVLERTEKRARREWDRQQMRRLLRQKFGHRCRLCGRAGLSATAVDFTRRAELHHVVPRSRAPERVDDPDNQVLLCAPCHLKVTAHEIQVAGTTAATFRRVG